MKAQAKLSDHAVKPPDTSVSVPAHRPAIDARAAANDELEGQRRETTENPLWVINIAMAAFFIVAALVMMTS